ncbi:MAG: hypothetical protein R2867_11165 [Caldilineaceae bacterium]
MPITNTDVVAESTYITDRGRRHRGLWLGLLSGPVVYALYFIVGYLLAEATCQGTVLRIRGELGLGDWGLTTLAHAVDDDLSLVELSAVAASPGSRGCRW